MAQVMVDPGLHPVLSPIPALGPGFDPVRALDLLLVVALNADINTDTMTSPDLYDGPDLQIHADTARLILSPVRCAKC